MCRQKEKKERYAQQAVQNPSFMLVFTNVKIKVEISKSFLLIINFILSDVFDDVVSERAVFVIFDAYIDRNVEDVWLEFCREVRIIDDFYCVFFSGEDVFMFSLETIEFIFYDFKI